MASCWGECGGANVGLWGDEGREDIAGERVVGEWGAIMPSPEVLRETFGRIRGRSIFDNIDLKRETRDGVGLEEDAGPADMGIALSFALRLRNRNNGVSQTHRAKKVAISANPGE